MVTPTEIDHSLPTIDHVGLARGIGQVIRWGFGEEDTPEDLTGRAAWIVLHPGQRDQNTVPCTVADHWVTYAIDEGDWASGAAYVLLVQKTAGGTRDGRCQGRLKAAATVAVTP